MSLKYYINKIKSYIPFTCEWNEKYNPYYDWFKARKYFKRPKWKLFYIGKEPTWFYGLPTSLTYYNKLIDIRLSSLGWKSKFNSPRHEWDPYFAITLFRKWQIVFTLCYGNPYNRDVTIKSNATWEAILDYLYFNIPIEKVVDNHIWFSGIGKDAYKITIEENMK